MTTALQGEPGTTRPGGGALWVRACPLCGRVLAKAEPLDRVRCPCGWLWD